MYSKPVPPEAAHALNLFTTAEPSPTAARAPRRITVADDKGVTVTEFAVPPFATVQTVAAVTGGLAAAYGCAVAWEGNRVTHAVNGSDGVAAQDDSGQATASSGGSETVLQILRSRRASGGAR